MAIRKQKEPKMANDDKPKDAAFIGRVVDDPANPTPTRLLTGWLGDAGEAGYRRLYADAELSSYVDISEEAILYTEAIRDAQPAGAVFVWIKRDAAVKQGGSAASRAGRFLQGRVAQDFSSPEKAGYRCVTQVPCGEPTGFTGQCTKQPDVGGAWPCLTALPLCSAEPTGFTGQCTHQPWPNPTRYVGCTVLHCPTNDLTHQPHICKIVESGMPGCGGGGEPPKPEAEGTEAAKAQPPTNIPGCGYTQTWGLCETHVGCPPQTNIPGCGWTQQWGLCNDTQAPKCQPSVQIPCITVTEMPQRCGGGFDLFAARLGGPGTLTRSGPCVTIDCTVAGEPCRTFEVGGLCRTETGPRCPQITVPLGCPPAPTPNTQCTVGGPECQTHQAPRCPTHQPCCTQTGIHCPPTPATVCTQAGPQCPDVTIGITCTALPPQCPDRTIGIACTVLPPQCPRETIGFACTAVAPQCPPTTQSGPQCPTPATMCRVCTNVPQICAAPEAAAVGAPNTAATTCTQFGHQCLSAVDACPTRLCGGGGGGGGQTAATVCTQFGHQCLSAVDACPTRLCGGGGGGGGQTAATVCTQFGPQCPTPATMCFVCTNVPQLCGVPEAAAVGAPNTAATTCTQFGQQCLSAVDACPTRLCDTRFGCGGGGHTAATVCTQFGHQCQSAVDACPTRLCGQQQFGAAAGIWPTPMTRCFIC
jgi:hypothetical protein